MLLFQWFLGLFSNRAKINRLQSQLQEQHETLKDLQERLSVQQQQLQTARDDLRARNIDLANVNSVCGDLTTEKNLLKAELESRIGELQVARQELETVKEDLRTRDAEFTNKNKVCGELIKNNNLLKAELESRIGKLQVARQELQTVKEDLRTRDAEFININKVCEELIKDKNLLKAELESRIREFEEMKRELAVRHEEQLRVQRAMLSVAQQDINSQTHINNNLTAAQEKLLSVFFLMEEENENYECEVEALRVTVADKTAELRAQDYENAVSQDELEHEQRRSAVLQEQLQELREQAVVWSQQGQPHEDNAISSIQDMEISMLHEMLSSEQHLGKLVRDELQYCEARLAEVEERECELLLQLEERGARLAQGDTRERRRLMLSLELCEARLAEVTDNEQQLMLKLEQLASENLSLNEHIEGISQNLTEEKLPNKKLKEKKIGDFEINQGAFGDETADLNCCGDKDESCHTSSCHNYEAHDDAGEKKSPSLSAAEREAARLAHLMRKRGATTCRCVQELRRSAGPPCPGPN